MKRFHRPFLALLLSLLLIGMQQAAFAHLLSHARSGTNVAAQYQSDHGAIDGVAETCTTCIAFAAVGGNAPPTSSHFGWVVPCSDKPDAFSASPPRTRLPLDRRARAPPALL